MTDFENYLATASETSEASSEQAASFGVDEVVKVISDSADAALLWQVAEVKEVSGYYILRAVGDPEGELHAFKKSEVAAASGDINFDKLSMPKLKPISEDEADSLIMSAHITEYIDSIGKTPERTSEAANDAIEDLGEQAVQEVVEEVVEEEVLVVDHEKNIVELKQVEVGLIDALSRASEVMTSSDKIDEKLAQLLGNLQQAAGSIRTLASFEGSGEDFRRRAQGLINGLLRKSESEFNTFRATSLANLEAHVFEVYSRTKAIEHFDKVYSEPSSDDSLTDSAKEAKNITVALADIAQKLRPLTVDMQAPLNASEYMTLAVTNKLKNTISDIDVLMKKSFRGPVDTAEFMRIAAAYDEYAPSSPAMIS